MTVTNAILEAFGKELYGEYWHGHVADIFGVSKRTVRRWDDGEIPIPDDAALFLRVVLVSKRDQIDRLLAHLEPPAVSHPEPGAMRSERSERATSLLPAKEGE